MRGLKTALLAAALFVIAGKSVSALSTCGPITVDAPTVGVLAQNAVEAEICNQIQQKFQTANLPQVMNYMAKANSLSGKGSVADYWSNPQVFALGAGATVSINNISPPLSISEFESLIKKYKENPVPDGGTGVSANATLGISFRHMPFRRRGWFDPKNFNVYFSFMITPQINYQIYSYKTTSVGAYVQYKVLPMRKAPFGLVTWGGLDLGLGYTFASSTLGVSSADALTSVAFSASGQTGTYSPTGTIALNYASHVIPLEVSTNVSLLYFLSFAVGMAADFNLLSSADISTNIEGKVKIDGQAQGTDYAKFSQSESAKITSVGFRAFFGPQINIWKVRIFSLLHITGDNSYAATVGARFSW